MEMHTVEGFKSTGWEAGYGDYTMRPDSPRCGDGTKAVRVECRIGGAGLNPCLAMAALLAAGIDGIENEMILEPEFKGDALAGRMSVRSRQGSGTLQLRLMEHLCCGRPSETT